jgi:hypothetical protein
MVTTREAEVLRPEPLRAVEIPERETRAERAEPAHDQRAQKSRPEPPRRGVQRAQPPQRTWRDALWGGEP